MNVLLTDHLVCPRCGPPFGLVLLARDVRDRRVRRGELGCSNCRDAFPVKNGFADLRPPPRDPPPLEPGGGASGAGGRAPQDPRQGKPPSLLAPSGGGSGDDTSGHSPLKWAPGGLTLGLAASLGVTEGPGLVMVSEAHRDKAVSLSRLVPGIEVIALGWGGRDFECPGAAVSPMVTADRLPFRDGCARGVVLAGEDFKRRWRESARVLVAGARVVITDPPPEARKRLESCGLVVVLDGEAFLAAGRKRV